MRKYKLFKIYPDSPNLNTVINECGYKDDGRGYILSNPQLYPEFWQEVIEKDYEILSYKHNDGRISISTTHSETYNMSLLATQGVTIYSVKRLSDGEIFTIGDICDDGKINEFYIEYDNLYLHFFSRINQSRVIEYCKKAKKPLFTTEDGVDIFEGSICWIVGPHFFSIYKCTNPTSKPIIFDEKYFSTEEAAKEYILMNKPCLCINDLMRAASITYCNLTALKELVKSKL